MLSHYHVFSLRGGNRACSPAHFDKDVLFVWCGVGWVSHVHVPTITHATLSKTLLILHS